MSITALPTPPSRQDPVNFAVRGDAFMAALPVFATEANALAVEMESAAATAASDAVAAAIAATSGSFVNTSSTQTVGGVKTFTSSPVMPGNATTALQAVPKQQAESIAASGGAPGAVSFFAMTSAPTGWLKANGASLSTTTYAALFAAIGYTFGGSGASFNLPDLRGEFIRSLDDSRGVDAGRSLGTFQGDQNKSHNHGGASGTESANHYHSGNTGDQSADHTHGYSESNYTYLTDFAAGVTVSVGVSAANTGGQSGNHHHSFTTDGPNAYHTHSISSDGGTEVRVRNVAMLACIKY